MSRPLNAYEMPVGQHKPQPLQSQQATATDTASIVLLGNDHQRAIAGKTSGRGSGSSTDTNEGIKVIVLTRR